ncbi:hypothetical protein GCM10010428_69330 [Actinosynnema pretiosum subsp. pretiosum]
MPPEVRDRLRRRVLGRDRYRVPLAAAAAAAALALGGVALSQATKDDGPAEQPPVTTTSTTPAWSRTQRAEIATPTADDRERCGAGADHVVVVRPEPVGAPGAPSARLVVDGDDFCELTATGAHRPAPTDQPVAVGDGVRLRWVSSAGVLVGELPEGAESVRASLRGGSPDLGAVSRDGLFFVPLNHRPDVDLAFDGGRAAGTSIPGGLFSTPLRTDLFPEARRAEPDQLVARCAYRAWLDGVIGSANPAPWQWLVSTSAQDGDHVVVLRDGAGELLECPTWDWSTRTSARREVGGFRRFPFALVGGHSEVERTTWFLTGVVDERATTVELTDASGRPAAEVALDNGWVAARFTDQLAQERPDFTGYRVRVLTGKEVLHEGPATTN